MEHRTSNEKFNSSQDWRSGLDGLCALPGEEKQDMNAAWDKLSLKLEKKKGSRKFSWYWIAAASVMIIILAMLITSKNKPGHTIQELVKNNQPVNKAEDNGPLTKHLSETVVKEPVKDKKSLAVEHKQVNAILKTLLKDPDTLYQIVVQHMDSLSIASVVDPVLPNKPITFPVLKKKLPVVHINDIDKPLAPVEVVAGNNEHAGLRIRLFNREIHMESPASNNENSNALKIKLSPQN